MKFLKHKSIKSGVIVIFASFILSTFVYAINNVDKTPSNSEILDSNSNQSIKVKESEKNNPNVNKGLSRDDILKLYNQGYSIVDIQKAESLSVKCNLSPVDILKIKGKDDFKVIKKISREINGNDNTKKDTKEILDEISEAKDYTKDYTIEDKSKSWDEVEKELQIDSKSDNGGNQ